MIVNLGWRLGTARASARALTESDRQAVADTLRRALDDGRLDPAEFEQRVATARTASTTVEIAAALAGLPAPARPPRRGRLDALFDRFVVNSALITAPRHRILKLVWAAAVAATLLGHGYFLVRHPIWAATVLWLPTYGLLRLETAAVAKLAGPTCARRKAVLARLGASLDLLRAAQPAITEITVDLVEGRVAEVRIDFDRTRPELAASVREEIIRLVWLSRLYPLTEIRLGDSRVRLDGDEEVRLRQRYGPRPYGPYPADQR